VAEARTLDDDEAIPGQGYASGFAKHVENQCLSLE
jgi:hypothetical protein